MTDRPATTSQALKEAREIGMRAGLNFVYVGNIPEMGGKNTYCPQCGIEIISHFGFSIRKNE